MMRKGIKADERLPFGELFFDGDFGTPLTPEKAGKLCLPLEMVRLAPSAVNKQPRRVVVNDGAAHFYLQRSRGFGGGVLDMQKTDVGIALCHFELTANELGIGTEFMTAEPNLTQKNEAEYIASYKFRI